MDSTLKSSLLLASILMVFTLSGCDISKDKEECAEPLVGLATCLTYVGGTAKAPTPDCCNGLKQLIKTNKKCLCVVIKDRNDPDLGLNINVTLALGLPHVCNAAANISQCPALLNMAPNSPDAQVFYQLEKNGSSTTPSPTTNTTAGSPVAGGPAAAEVVPNPTSTPAGSGTTGAATSPQKSGGCVRAKSNGWLSGLLLLLPAALLV